MTRALRFSLALGILSAIAVTWIAPAQAVEPSVTQVRSTADWPHPTSRRRRWPARLAGAMDGATSLATAS